MRKCVEIRLVPSAYKTSMHSLNLWDELTNAEDNGAQSLSVLQQEDCIPCGSDAVLLLRSRTPCTKVFFEGERVVQQVQYPYHRERPIITDLETVLVWNMIRWESEV